ncbi:unnamed protein product [Blepharisma stoltei]|uniref:TmcB/TmcC TPR repeats domain-containing protein n=1 Tax=Blepharisma stoltei TaxID=1481888 RepID=A0AAU9JX84_9CILI|nr:unnamed protein product [Blepharisma stoltei]
MILDSLENFFETTKTIKFKAKKSLYEKQKLIIFKIFGKICKSKYIRGYKIKSQIMIEVLLSTVICLQIIGLAWHPDMSISGWNHYIAFWNIVSYFNVNDLSDAFKISEYWFYGILSIVAFCISTFSAMVISAFAKMKFPKILLFVFRNLLSFCVTLLYIPSLVEFSMIFKYSTFNCDKISEYTYSKDPKLLDYGIGGAIFSIFAMIYLILMAYFWELFTADIRHFFKDKNLTTRSHSSFDLKLLTLRTFMSISYVLFADSDTTKYQVIFLAASILVFIESLVKLSYYNKAENAIKSCKVLSVAWIFLVFLLGTAMDNAGIIFILIFFLQPILIGINCWIVYIRLDYIEKCDIDFSSQHKFEKTIRKILWDKELENKAQVIDYFQVCYNNKKLTKDKLLVIWEVNYCLFAMKDERLARIKLTKINSVSSSIEGSIQEWRSNKNIEEKGDSLTDIHYLEYLADIDKVKQQDEEICCTLIDLWSEFSAKIPQYKKIYHLVVKSSDLLTSLKEFYAKLVSKHKHLELFDLYSSFLENVLGDEEQANIINRLKTRISQQLYFNGNDDKNLSLYEDNAGIILISANEDTFGIITYINEKAAQLLKGSISDFIGSHFSYYIPDPYSYNHDDHMKDFYNNYKKEEILQRGGFFLQNTLGYLIECRFLIKLTAFHNNAYFLVSLTPRTTNRQLALISEKGIIYNYSELFPHYIGANFHNIRNYHIKEFVPDLNISKMKLFEPLVINNKGKEIALVHAIKKLRLAVIHTIIMVIDEDEIKLWKDGQETDQIEFFQKNVLNHFEEEKTRQDTSDYQDNSHSVKFKKSILSFKSVDEDKETGTNGAADETFSENLRESEGTEEKSLSNMQGSISNSSTRIANKYIEKMIKHIKIFQWVLFLCTLATISTSIAILAYIYQETIHTISLSVFADFGKLMFYLASSADLARSLDNDVRYGFYNLTKDLELFTDSISHIKSLKNALLDDYSDWNYCDGSKLVLNQIIPVWSFEPSPHMTKYNIYDEVELYISHGEELITLLSDNSYDLDDVKFFVLNSLGFSFEYINIALQSLTDCEVNRVEEIGLSVSLWLYVGVSFLGFFFFILIGCALWINKKYDDFWNFIRKITHLAFLETKRACIQRLSSVHGLEYEVKTYTTQAKIAKSKERITSGVYVKYIWRLFVFVILTTMYFTLSKFYFYDQCENFLHSRPRLLQNLVVKRAQLSRMSVFARDCTSPSNIIWFPNSYGFKNSRIEYNLSSTEFKAMNFELRKKEFLDLMSHEMKVRIFEIWDTTDFYIQQGTFAASNLLFLDSINIAAVTGFRPIPEYAAFMGNVSALQYSLGVDFDTIDQDSKDIISDQLNWLIYETIIFIIALVLLFMFFYMPFIRAEKKTLRKLQVLTSIIPNIRIDEREIIK